MNSSKTNTSNNSAPSHGLTDEEIIQEIQDIRRRNNTYWMDSVRMCFELAPSRARSLFSKIKECDRRIQELSDWLANNDSQTPE